MDNPVNPLVQLKSIEPLEDRPSTHCSKILLAQSFRLTALHYELASVR